ncbi:VOC family protein [Sphingosinithalassobacter portus]|uniref:VOC family protein n=1 Tax=Stakelama portus TaxID=2676234 RepID=UPI000D6DC744|nr:VOC family protein [Sphingosinithalassobacter portus]
MSHSKMFENQSLDDALFRDCTMTRTRFDDVRLADARFENVDLQRVHLRNVNLTDGSIEDADISGLKIMGHDVSDLIRQQRNDLPSVGTNNSSDGMAVEPQLYVGDLDRSCEFYCSKLGFHIAFSYGEPPFYAQVVRGGWRLNLRVVHGPVFDGGFRDREADALSATLTIGDARPVFREWQEAEVDFHQPLKEEPWGAIGFILRDPDGNLIAVAGRPAEAGL